MAPKKPAHDAYIRPQLNEYSETFAATTLTYV